MTSAEAKLDIVVLTARPAAGKSEVIAYLKQLSPAQRFETFGLGAIEEVDDFPYVWESFEIDDILSKYGRPRAFTNPDYTFKDDPMMWTLFLERINLEFRKRMMRDPDYLKARTLFIEFARGGEGAIRNALGTLDPAILRRAAILYIDVSYEESVRKNRARARPGQADSILYHSLPDEKMDRYYRTNDWVALSGGQMQGSLEIQEVAVPFVVFENEDDKTSDPARLGPELQRSFALLRKQPVLMLENADHASRP